VNITFIRDGSERIVSVTLRNKDGDTNIIKNVESVNLLGATFEKASTDEKSKLGINGGIKISKLVAGKLRSAGIKEGFIITSIDKKPIRTTSDLEDALKSKQGGVLIEGVYPNGMRAYYGFGI
jgi:S1-C subfamily serine protease